jgi:hypothetical protein
MIKSIFIPHAFSPTYFSAAGFSVNLNSEVPSDFVYTAVDSAEMFAAVQNFANKHGIVAPSYVLCDKQKAYAKFVTAGFTTLDTVSVKTRADLENFPHDKVILKPNVSFNTSSHGLTLDSVMYCVRDKAELLLQLDVLGAFEGSTVTSEPFIAQQVADGDGDEYTALIASGAVNGAGVTWHLPPLELNTYFKDKVRKVKSVWSEDNNTSEVLHLRDHIDALLAAENAKNCFYQLQFLRAGNSWVPHDFQYRMTYYAHDYLGSPHLNSPYIDYKNAMVKYAYDTSTEKPVLPTNFGLSFQPTAKPFGPPIEKTFITGQSKSEVLSKLGAM